MGTPPTADVGAGPLFRHALFLPLAAASCGGWSGGGPDCRPVADPVALPAVISESSGVAVSRSRPGVYWTMNDGQGPVLYAVRASGEIVDSVVLDVPARDWEDLALTECGGRDCLWVADTGDNYRERDSVVVYRLTEPEPGAAPGEVEAFPARFPDGPRDVEALFVLPGEDVRLISKGGEAPPTVYRFPGPPLPDTLVTLEEVERLGEAARALPRRITGADASRDGRIVAVRTYETLTFMASGEDGRLQPLEGGETNLRTLREAQGEAVGLGPDGEAVLTSEAGPLGGRGSLTVLRCRLPEVLETTP